MDKATAYALGAHLSWLGFSWTLVRNNATGEWVLASVTPYQ